MSQKDKLLQRLRGEPKDFTFDELKHLLGLLDYELSNKGKTSGSRVKFEKEGHNSIYMHKPHGGNVLLEYQVKDVIDALKYID